MSFFLAGAGSSKPAVAMSRSLPGRASRKAALLGSLSPQSRQRRRSDIIAEPGTRSIIEMVTAAAMLDGVEVAALQVIDHCIAGTGDRPAFVDQIRKLAAVSHGSDPEASIFDLPSGAMDTLAEDQLRSLALPPRDYIPVEQSKAWIQKWLQNPATHDTVHAFQTDVGMSSSLLSSQLAILRHEDESAWRLIVGGQFRAILHRDEPCGRLDVREVRKLVRQQALFFYYVNALMKGHLVRRWNTKPMGDLVSIDCAWPFMASVLSSHIVVPAEQISAVMTALPTSFAQISSSTNNSCSAPIWLRDARLVAMAEKIQSRMLARHKCPSSFSKVVQVIAAELECMLSFDRPSLSQQGLGRREFLIERMGVTASQSSVILAMALLKAEARINICIDAVCADRAIPQDFALDFRTLVDFGVNEEVPDGAVSARALARTSMYLRRHTAMDRHHHERSAGAEETNAGSAMVLRTKRQFLTSYPHQAVAILVQDPALWFA